MAYDRRYRGALARSIKVLRGTRTQKEVAEAAGIPTSTWCKIEQARQVPRDATFGRIAAALGCSTTDLERVVSERVLRELDQHPAGPAVSAGSPESASRRAALTLQTIEGLRQQIRTFGEQLDTLELDLKSLRRELHMGSKSS